MALNDAVDKPCNAYNSMVTVWGLVDSLMGGTTAMRGKAETYLPRETAETRLGYQARLNKTFLFNGFKRTVASLTGKPFSEDVQVSNEVQGDPKTWMNDVDKLGNDITTFARNAFHNSGLPKGIIHILCDYPSVDGVINLQQKAEQEVRPYFVLVQPENLIGWRYSMESGVPVLTQLRIREIIQSPDGDFDEVTVRRVRVFDRIVQDGVALVGWRLFELRKDSSNQDSWVQIDNGLTTTSKIPLATAYIGQKTDVLLAEAPLEDLAWMNVEHWQSSSDQRHILHVARVPVWFMKGYQPSLDTEGNVKDKIEIGPDRMIMVSSENADLKVVEHTGAGISAGRTDLMDIQTRMAIQGAAMLMPKQKGETTATEESHTNRAEDSDLQAAVKSFEDCLTAAIGFMYEWEKKTPPAGKLVTINTDFGLTPQDAADLQVLYQSRVSGLVSHATYLKELARRGVLAPDLDLALELQNAKSDGPVIDPNKQLASEPRAGGGVPTASTKAGPGA